MAEVAGALVTDVLVRTRDPQGDRDNARAMISQAQQFLNAAVGTVTATTSLTLEPERQVYPVQATLPACVRVLSVRDGSRDLDQLPWRLLARLDRSWFRRLASQPEAWATIGRDLLVVHPGVRVTQTVTVVYVKLTTVLDQDTTATDVPDPLLPAVLDLAEILLLLQRREIGSIRATSLRLASRISEATLSQVPTSVLEAQP